MVRKEQEKKKLPNRELSFKLEGKDYLMKFPNTGELMEIAIMRARLSGGKYDMLSNTQILGDKLAQFSIDTIVHFSILSPDLLKNLNVKSYLDLELMDMKKIITLYIKEVLPWLNTWYEVLNSIDEDTE